MEVAVSVSEVLDDTYVRTDRPTLYVQHSFTGVPCGWMCVRASPTLKDPEFSLEDEVSIPTPISNLIRGRNALHALQNSHSRPWRNH